MKANLKRESYIHWIAYEGLAFISQSYFAVPKTIAVNLTH